MYRPWMNRRFGVEMEMNDVNTRRQTISGESIVQAIRNGLQVAGYRTGVRGPFGYVHSDGQYWEVKTDGSCGYNGRTGWEVAQPHVNTMLDEHGENAELKVVCDALATLTPRVDRSCGLHVNIDVRDFDWKDLRALIILWSRYEPYWFEMCPASRASNTYCPPMRKSRWTNGDTGHWTRVDHTLNTAAMERDFTTQLSATTPRGALNLGHFWRSKRLEFRLGAGTISYEKIVRWVQLLLTIVQRAKNGVTENPVARTNWDALFNVMETPMPQILPGNWSNKAFSTPYIAKLLGLAPSTYVPANQIPPESGRLIEWMDARRALFTVAAAADPIETAITRRERLSGARDGGF